MCRASARSRSASFSSPFIFCSDGLLVKNEEALAGALSTVETFAGVQALVADGVARCVEKMKQQEALSQESKEEVLQLLVRSSLMGGRASISLRMFCFTPPAQ